MSRLLLKPVLVGGSIDNTGGTLTAPDLDFNIEWELDEEVTSHLDIRPTDQGESGQYTLQVYYAQPNSNWLTIFLGHGRT